MVEIGAIEILATGISLILGGVVSVWILVEAANKETR